MKKELKIFKCLHCGNIIIKLIDNNVDVYCCNEKMKVLIPGEIDASVEKHIPKITINNNTITVNIGEIKHPMEDKHYIQFILIETNSGFQIKYLNPQDEPICTFITDENVIAVYGYCNIHGLWKKQVTDN